MGEDRGSELEGEGRWERIEGAVRRGRKIGEDRGSGLEGEC